MNRPWRQWITAAIVLTGVAGCSAASHPEVKTHTSARSSLRPEPLPSNSPSRIDPSLGTPGLGYEVVANLRVPAPVNHVALTSGLLAFAAASQKSSDGRLDSISVYDLRTKSLKTVVESQWATGWTDWPELYGNWLIWTDVSSMMTDGWKGDWTLEAEDLQSGRRVRLDAGSNSGYVPIPRATDRGVVWDAQTASGDGSVLMVKIWTDDMSGPRTLRLGPQRFRSGSEYLLKDSSVLLVSQDGQRSDSSVFSIVSAKISRLSNSGKILDVATNGVLALVTSRAALNNHLDPYRLDLVRVGDPSVQTTLQKGAFEGNAVLGDNFAAWLTREGHVALSYLNGKRVDVGAFNTGTFYVPGRLAAHGDTVAFATLTSDTEVDIHVLQVR